MAWLYRLPFFLSCASLTIAPCWGEEQAVIEAPAPALPTHEMYFSPQDKVDDKLISLIENEKEDIHAAVYCLTHRGIIKALMDARKRGVNVDIIVDPMTVKARAPLKRMAQAGINVYVWSPKALDKRERTKNGKKEPKPLMHNKFCVFGNKTVWTGSFNFTSQASVTNQENVVVLHDPEAGKKYIEDFERVKEEGCSTFRTFLANRTLKKKKSKLL